MRICFQDQRKANLLSRKSPLKSERGESVPPTSTKSPQKGRPSSPSSDVTQSQDSQAEVKDLPSTGAKNRGRSSPPATEPQTHVNSQQLIEENKQLKIENLALRNELQSIKQKVSHSYK